MKIYITIMTAVPSVSCFLIEILLLCFLLLLLLSVAFSFSKYWKLFTRQKLVSMKDWSHIDLPSSTATYSSPSWFIFCFIQYIFRSQNQWVLPGPPLSVRFFTRTLPPTYEGSKVAFKLLCLLSALLLFFVFSSAFLKASFIRT